MTFWRPSITRWTLRLSVDFLKLSPLNQNYILFCYSLWYMFSEMTLCSLSLSLHPPPTTPLTSQPFVSQTKTKWYCAWDDSSARSLPIVNGQCDCPRIYFSVACSGRYVLQDKDREQRVVLLDARVINSFSVSVCLFIYLYLCVRACVRAWVGACVRAWVRSYVRARQSFLICASRCMYTFMNDVEINRSNFLSSNLSALCSPPPKNPCLQFCTKGNPASSVDVHLAPSVLNSSPISFWSKSCPFCPQFLANLTLK